MIDTLKEIAAHFTEKDEIESVTPFGSGHIHDTYLVKTRSGASKNYILQHINTAVFQDPEAVMNNMALVTSHIRKKLLSSGSSDPDKEVVTVVPAVDGQLLFTDSEQKIWRCLVFIPDTKTYDRAENADQVYEGGKAFGKFLSLLSDLQSSKLKETIKDFHNIDWRLTQFHQSLNNGVKERITAAEKEINQVLEREEDMRLIRKLSQKGLVPQRIVHHDTKINNVLFDQNDKALCVIDLDTVMPGYVHDDFGDAIRTFTNTGDEDEADVSKVSMNIRFFEAFTNGFMKSAGSMLTQVERDYLALSAMVMTYMQVIRFLSDYLNGDVYYKIHHPEHNMQRTKAQLALLFSMESQFSIMKEIVKKS